MTLNPFTLYRQHKQLERLADLNNQALTDANEQIGELLAENHRLRRQLTLEQENRTIAENRLAVNLRLLESLGI